MSGLRRGEPFALRWRDFDERQSLTVREAVYDGTFSTPKTAAGVRQIPSTGCCETDRGLTRACEAHGTRKVIAQPMGRAKVDITLNVYTQVVDGSLRRAADLKALCGFIAGWFAPDPLAFWSNYISHMPADFSRDLPFTNFSLSHERCRRQRQENEQAK